MLVGNKCDLEERRAVSSQEGAKFASDNGLLFVETSAKTAMNISAGKVSSFCSRSYQVSAAFVSTAENIYGKMKAGKYDPSREGSGIKFGALSGGKKPTRPASSGSCC